MSSQLTLDLSHVRFLAEDPVSAAASLTRESGMQPIPSAPWAVQGTVAPQWLRGGGAVAVVHAAGDNPCHHAFLSRHGFGVVDMALETPDVEHTYAQLIQRGVHSIRRPERVAGQVQAVVAGFGDVTHTLVERKGGPLPDAANPVGVEAFDHFAVLVPAKQLQSTVDYYATGFGFNRVFAEQINVGDQTMNSSVVANESRTVTLTIMEPELAREPGQVDQFLKNHAGAGVQHVAYLVPDIVTAVTHLTENGLKFLDTPDEYYEALPQRVGTLDRDLADLRRLGILVDEDHDGRLYQIFARSQHPQRTSFAEVIERHGAKTFGRGNITALYEAVQRSGEA